MNGNITYDRTLSSKFIEENFDYDLSLKSESEISNLVEEKIKDVATIVANIGREIRDQLYDQELQLGDINMLYFHLVSAYDGIQAIVTYIKKLKENKEYNYVMDEIYKHLNDINLKFSNENLFIFRKIVQYLHFIKNKTGKETINSLKWTEGLSDVISYLNNSKTWYSFLNNLYNTLSKYEIQKNIRHYLIVKENLKSSIDSNENEVEKIKVTLSEFLSQVMQQDSDEEYNKIKYVKLDKPKLKSLNKLLDFTLEDNVIVSCNNATHGLTLQGKYIKLSNITDDSCPFRPKLIELHAIDKIFIDISFNKTGEKVQLFIISPTWDIIGSPKIILNGESGDIHDTIKARDGLGPGQKGKDGKAGKPGGSAGHFLGIGETFINGGNLEIYSNGGKGGRGQNGGNGIAGKNAVGPTVPVRTSTCNEKTCEEYRQTYNFDCKYLYNDMILDVGGGFTKSYRHRYVFGLGSKVPSKDLSIGGTGGHGGSSGIGGNAGKVILFTFDKESEIKFYNNTGEKGEKGVGGSGKKGGYLGKFIHASCLDIYKYWTKNQAFDFGYDYSGLNGKDGYNDEDLDIPEIVPIANPSFSVNKYKYYFRASFTNSIVKQSFFRAFYNKLEENSHITNLYDTLGLVEDFEGVENQFYKLRKEFSFLPTYQSLLRRINEYIKNKLNKYLDKKSMLEDKKILDYLYAAALSRICRIKNNYEDNLVVNLNVFVNETVNEIHKLQDFEEMVLIDSYQEKLQEVINARTKEAENYIEFLITPEIERIIKSIEDEIEKVIEKIIELENEGEKKKEELIKAQNELKGNLIIRVALNSLKIIGTALSFLGPLGALAGALIGGGAIVAESFILDNPDSSGNIPPLPDKLTTSFTKIPDEYKYQQTLLTQQINDIALKLNEFSDEGPTDSITKIKQQTTIIENKLNQLKNRTDSSTLKSVRNLRKDMKELLKKEKVILDNRKIKGDSTIEKKIRFVTYAQNVISLSEVSLDFYSKYKQDEVKLNKAGKSISIANKEINQIIQYENEIYNKLIPMWRNLENIVTKIKDKLKHKSQIALDVTKWQIQSTLKDVKYLIKEITGGFKNRSDLLHYMEKLENCITFMINLYDRIEYYRYNIELTTYITNIINGKSVIENKKKNDAINKLKLTIQSNLVLEKYEIAMNAIRQYTFPFGDFYLSEYDLQDFMNLNDTHSLGLHTRTIITNLQNKLTISSATTNIYDNYIAINAEFNRRVKHASVLFVWKHDKSGNIIPRLLEGEEITVTANIKQGLNKDAVKFNDIGIRFELPDKIKQHALREQLDHFKLKMTHLGNNYYKCGDKIYLIFNKRHTLTYDIAKKRDGTHSQTYLNYDKIHDNCPVFSPYATWKIQLINISASFDNLISYKSEPIDLQLVGRGKYIEEGSGACKSNLNKYYTLFDSTSRIISNKSDNVEVLQEDYDDTLDDVGISKICKANDLHRLARSLDDDIPKQKNITDLFVTTKTYNITKSYFTNTELPEVSHISNNFHNDEAYNTVNNIENNSLLYNTSNLLFLDLLIRQKSGIKYKQKTNIKSRNDSNHELAQTLAYRGHFHKR